MNTEIDDPNQSVNHHDQKYFLQVYYSEEGKNLRKRMTQAVSELDRSEGETAYDHNLQTNEDGFIYSLQNYKQQNYGTSPSFNKITLLDNSEVEHTQANLKGKEVSMTFSPNLDFSNPPTALQPTQINYPCENLSPQLMKAIKNRQSLKHPTTTLFYSTNKSKTVSCNNMVVDYQARQEIKHLNVQQNESTVHHVVNNLRFVAKIKQRIIYFLKNYTVSGRSRCIEKEARIMLNDKSDFVEKNNGNIVAQIMKIINYTRVDYFCYLLPLLNPASFFGMCVEFAFGLINCIIFYIYSLVIVFPNQVVIDTQFNLIMSLLWLFEIGIRLNSIKFLETTITRDRRKIFNLYLRERAFFDIIAIIFVNISVSNQLLQIIIKFCVFFKLRNLMLDIESIQNSLSIVVEKYYLVKIFNLFFILFFLGHIISICWCFLTQSQINKSNDPVWILKSSIQNDGSWWQLYLSAVYLSFSVITKGTYLARTIEQALFIVIILPFSLLIFSYILSEIGIILSERDESEQKKRRDLSILHQYMRDKKISKEEFSMNSLTELCSFMEEVYYLPNQIIVLDDQLNDQYLYYIESGREECKSVINELKKGDTLGEVGFFTGTSKAFLAKSSDFAKLIKIKRSDFLKIVKRDEKDFQSFCQIKDSLFLYENLEILKQKCPNCNNYIHSLHTCHKVHLNKKWISTKIGFSQTGSQERHNHNRRFYKQNSLQNYQSINSAQQYYIDHHKSILFHDFYKTAHHKLDAEFQSFPTDTESYYTSKQQQNIQQNLLQNLYPGQKVDSKNYFEEYNPSPSLLNQQWQKSLQYKDNDSFISMGTYLDDSSKMIGQPLKESNQHIEVKLQKCDTKEDLLNPVIGNEDGIYDKTKKSRKSQQNTYYSSSHNTRTIMKKLSLKLPDEIKRVKIDEKQQSVTQGTVQTHVTPVQLIKQQVQNAYDFIQYYDNPWLFENLKDYLYYFYEGNSQLQILKHNRKIRKLKKNSTKGKSKAYKSIFMKISKQ